MTNTMALGSGGEDKGHVVARTGRPQPTQSSNTVPSLFIPPFGVPTPDGVPASLGGVPGLEPASVLCDALAATVALGRVGACTSYRYWRTGEKEEQRRDPVRNPVSSESITGKMKPQLSIPCLQLRTHVRSVRSTTVSNPFKRNVLCVADVAFLPVPRYLLV